MSENIDENIEMAEKTYYYAIAYTHNGGASISRPFESYEEMMEKLKEAVSQNPERVESTSYITRKERLSVKDILGHPKSRDIMRDKKFLASLTER